MNNLRVGICGCTHLYHGDLEGRKWIINTLGGNAVIPRITFELKEVLIPENMQTSTLLTSRCHFFVDMHYSSTLSRPYLTSALLEDYVPRSRTGAEVPFSGWGFYMGWNTKEPIGTFELLKSIRSIIMKMDEDDMYGWLIHLSPGTDPRPLRSRTERWEDFETRVSARRQQRLKEYHCYPACTSSCH